MTILGHWCFLLYTNKSTVGHARVLTKVTLTLLVHVNINSLISEQFWIIKIVTSVNPHCH